MKEWKNERGTGEKFTMDICDDCDKIRCIFFGEAANKHHGLIEVRLSIKCIEPKDSKKNYQHDKLLNIKVKQNIYDHWRISEKS